MNLRCQSMLYLYEPEVFQACAQAAPDETHCAYRTNPDESSDTLKFFAEKMV